MLYHITSKIIGVSNKFLRLGFLKTVKSFFSPAKWLEQTVHLPVLLEQKTDKLQTGFCCQTHWLAGQAKASSLHLPTGLACQKHWLAGKS